MLEMEQGDVDGPLAGVSAFSTDRRACELPAPKKPPTPTNDLWMNGKKSAKVFGAGWEAVIDGDIGVR